MKMKMKMTLVLISLPSLMRTVGWVSQVFLRLVFQGLLSPRQGTTTIFRPLLVQLQERHLPGDHRSFQGFIKACRFGFNSSGLMRSSGCWTPFLVNCQLGFMNGKLLLHRTTRISETKNEQGLHFVKSLHSFKNLRNLLGTLHDV